MYIYRVSGIGNRTIWSKFLINFDPDYLVDEIKSRQQLIVETRSSDSLFEVFSTIPTIFQNANNPSEIFFEFSFKICVNNFVVIESSTILDKIARQIILLQ
jgi:hypothetical protein